VQVALGETKWVVWRTEGGSTFSLRALPLLLARLEIGPTQIKLRRVIGPGDCGFAVMARWDGRAVRLQRQCVRHGALRR